MIDDKMVFAIMYNYCFDHIQLVKTVTRLCTSHENGWYFGLNPAFTLVFIVSHSKYTIPGMISNLQYITYKW